MTADKTQVRRAVDLLTGSRFMVLATYGASGPWAATVNHVVSSAGSLLFCSDPRSRHCRQLAASPTVAATVYSVGPGQAPLDGLQLRGRCAPAAEHETARLHEEFFTGAYRDVATRDQALIPLWDFGPGGSWRLYTIDIVECWVRDLIARRARRPEQRVPVPVQDLIAALATRSP